jgi:hypothetical protein
MVVAPSVVGVKVAVYAVPEPAKLDRVPPETTTSSAANPEVDSLMVNVTAMLPSFVVEPVVTPLVVEAIVIVNAVESEVQAKVLETSFWLPAESANLFAATEMLVAPSVVGVKVAV